MTFLPSPDEAPSGSIVVYGGLFGPPSQAGPLALLGQAAHHWNGGILRFAPNRFLRGQRKKPASLERPSFDCVLAVACSRWDPRYCPRLVVASAGTSAGHALIKRADYPQPTILSFLKYGCLRTAVGLTATLGINVSSGCVVRTGTSGEEGCGSGRGQSRTSSCLQSPRDAGTSLHVSLQHPRTRGCRDDGAIRVRLKDRQFGAVWLTS